MLARRVLQEFFAPWIAFAILGALAAGFVLGAVVTFFGFIAAVFTLLGGITGGTTLQAVTAIARSFPDFALIVLGATAYGFVCGFVAAFIAALIGGSAGFWWSFLVALSAICLFNPFYQRHFGSGTENWMGAILSVCGSALAHCYLDENDAPKMPFGAAIGSYLGRSWLADVPQSARLGGILLPALLFTIWEIKLVGPEFARHQNYAARIGNWATWQSSRRLRRPIYARSSSCQSNLKQIMLGIKQYAQDYDELLPPAPNSPQHGVSAILQPYLKSFAIFQCPQELYSVPDAPFESGDFTDYWFNARFYGLNESKISNLVSGVQWGDGNTGAGEANAAYSLRNLPPTFAPATRHMLGANYAFADGHVKWLKPGAVSNVAPPRGVFSPTLAP
ncbi:MAG TPA: H-X9-DG-CTERM domain-containing protein [Abditibacterium sp.]|jgi:prepilin-type processing-associated H-X9-DG protein